MAILSVTQKLTIGSAAFAPGEFIPDAYTCKGINVNPPLTIENIPPGTKTLAVIVEDHDAPGGIFDHWLIWNIKPQEMIVEGLSATGTEGRNSFGNSLYKGPCPPPGKPHRYFFKVFALDAWLEVKRGAAKTELVGAMQNHILASGEIIGMYARK